MNKPKIIKSKYRGRTTKIKSKLKNLPVNYLTDKLSTTLSIDLDCFNGNGKFLYIGTVLSEYCENGENSRPKMGKSETNVLQTIMDTSDPNIIFNDLGESDFYTNFVKIIKPSWDTGELGLKELIKISFEREGRYTNTLQTQSFTVYLCIK